MAVANAHVLHGILNGASFISQVTNARVSPQINEQVSFAAGLPVPLFVGNLGQNPDITFDTTQLVTILDLVKSSTTPIIKDLSGANTDLYFKVVAERGTRTADASLAHLRFRAAEAVLICNQITAGHQSEASASCRIALPYDGTNEPLVPAGSLALAGTPSAATHFVAGPVFINTVQVTGIQDITIDFGWQLFEIGGGGELYNTFLAVQSQAPSVTITTTNVPWPTYGLNGTALTALSVYLRKVSATGRVANGTAQHIKFAATAGDIFISDTTSGNNDMASTTIRMPLVAPSATGDPLSITSTAVAITS
jgi:hypothetical protein